MLSKGGEMGAIGLIVLVGGIMWFISSVDGGF